MSIICSGVLQYLLGGVRRVNGWLQVVKTGPHFPPTDSKEVLLSVGLPSHSPPPDTSGAPPLPGELAMESKASKGVINSTSVLGGEASRLSGHSPLFLSLYPQNKLSPLQKRPLYLPWLRTHSGNWPVGQRWVLSPRLGKVGDLGVGKGKNPLK